MGQGFLIRRRGRVILHGLAESPNVRSQGSIAHRQSWSCHVKSHQLSSVRSRKSETTGARSICFWVSKALLFAISALHASVGPRGRPTTPNPVVSTILICFDLICPVENGQEGCSIPPSGFSCSGPLAWARTAWSRG